MAVLDVRKSLSILFISISHRYATLIFLEIFNKIAVWVWRRMVDHANDGHLLPRSLREQRPCAFLNVQFHFGCPNFTFNRISGHFRSICNFNFLGEIFDKMAADGHFRCPKFNFDRISGHFRSIDHFGFPKFAFDHNSGHFRSIQIFFSAAILDV